MVARLVSQMLLGNLWDGVWLRELDGSRRGVVLEIPPQVIRAIRQGGGVENHQAAEWYH